MQEPFRVILTEDALANLLGIHEFIGRGSPQNASLVAERLLNEIDRLGTGFARHKIVGKSRETGSLVHALTVRPFIVYYRFEQHPRAVYIITIVHGSQQQPTRFA